MQQFRTLCYGHYRKDSFRRSISQWLQPEGFDTKMKVYNCVAREGVPLIVKNKHFVSFYTCGPTVYNDSHIGHASCYMRLDILQRILRQHIGLNIVSTMNITDIDDKIIMRSNILNQPIQELTQIYETSFWDDLDALRIQRPNHVLRVTDNMDAIIDFVKRLVDENFAYKARDKSVYFDVKMYQSKRNNCKYGKLHNIAKETKTEDNNEGSKTNPIKRNDEDFALWKCAKDNEPKWDSPFGPGRPGWHIECSAMASAHFGNPIDIHAGGIDLRFPHHENEEAQSCAYHKCDQWVNYWLHCGHLHLRNDAKMSKSLKNTISIREILQMSSPNAFRMLCLLTNYKYAIEFSPESLKLAETHIKTIASFIANIGNVIRHQTLSIDPNILQNLLTQTAFNVDVNLRNDFDTAAAMKNLETLISTCNKILHDSASASTKEGRNSHASLLAIRSYVQNMVNIFGLDLECISQDDTNFHKSMDLLVNFRHQLRILSLERKDSQVLQMCDDVRNDCKKFGVSLQDHSKISTWSK